MVRFKVGGTPVTGAEHEPHPPQLTPIFGGTTLLSKIADVEAILGLIFQGFITLGVVLGVSVGILQFMIYSRPHPPQWMWCVLAPCGLAVILAQCKTLQAVGASLEAATHPRPLTMALSQRIWPVWLRPLVATWWMGQCTLLLWAAHAMSQSYGFIKPTGAVRAFEITLQTTVLFMGAYASNCSLLFAVAALGPSRDVLRLVWRFRVLIDVAVAFALLLLWPADPR